ncbi:hypothetical protein ACFL16_02700 [Patescibacteria group bacterium]
MGGLEIVLGIIFIKSQAPVAVALIVLGIILIVAGSFLSKEKIAGVYLSWIFVAIGTITAISNAAYLALIILAYFAYWTYKAQKAIKESTGSVVQEDVNKHAKDNQNIVEQSDAVNNSNVDIQE